MKIATLAFVLVNNYGAELQIFALQKKLKILEYDVTVLNVRRPNDSGYVTYPGNSNFKPLSDNSHSVNKRNILLAKLITKIFNMFFYRRLKKRSKIFHDFHSKYTNLSFDTYVNFEQLYTSELPYTHYIVGSDQVWNYSYRFSVEPYFLTFANKNTIKISYAASVGHADFPQSVAMKYKEWLQDFTAISIREREGAKLISDLLGKECPNVLDPTLLLSRDEWLESLEIKTGEMKKPYVLVYLLDKSFYSIELAKKIAAKLNAEVKVIVPNTWSLYSFIRGITSLYNVGPREFVTLFSEASFVVTNSFHGTAFSVNFNIPFFSTTRRIKSTNSRFLSLLSASNLIDRLIYEEKNEISEKDLNVDFSSANIFINEEKQKSVDFLLKAINNEINKQST